MSPKVKSRRRGYQCADLPGFFHVFEILPSLDLRCHSLRGTPRNNASHRAAARPFPPLGLSHGLPRGGSRGCRLRISTAGRGQPCAVVAFGKRNLVATKVGFDKKPIAHVAESAVVAKCVAARCRSANCGSANNLGGQLGQVVI